MNMPREHDRTTIPLEIVLKSSSGHREVCVSDLSLGGCFVDSIAAVQEGETISFMLGPSSDQGDEMIGEVAYVMAGIGFGVHFKNLTETQKLRIRDIIVAHGGTP